MIIYKCEYCDKTFDRRPNLLRHYKRKFKCYDANKIQIIKLKNENNIDASQNLEIDDYIETEFKPQNNYQNITQKPTQTQDTTQNPTQTQDNTQNTTQTQDNTQNTTQNPFIEPINDITETNIEPINDITETNIEPINDITETNIEPINDITETDIEPIIDTITEEITETNTEPIKKIKKVKKVEISEPITEAIIEPKNKNVSLDLIDLYPDIIVEIPKEIINYFSSELTPIIKILFKKSKIENLTYDDFLSSVERYVKNNKHAIPFKNHPLKKGDPKNNSMVIKERRVPLQKTKFKKSSIPKNKTQKIYVKKIH